MAATSKQSRSVTHLTIAETQPGLQQHQRLPDILSQVAYLRLWQIVDCNKKNVMPLLPIGRTSFLTGVKDGRFPKPVKIAGTKCNCWRSDDIAALILELDAQK